MTVNTTTYTVTGMTCGHCAASVREEISAIPGVAVDVASGAVEVTAKQPVTREQVAAAVDEAGYALT